jgi:hypothetical protein
MMIFYHTDMSNNVFPPFTSPPQPLDDEVLLGRALCKVFLIECKTCLRHELRNQHSIEEVTARMTHVDHHYVINRHFAGTSMESLPDYRNMVNNRRLDDIPYLIPFRQVALSHVAATLLTFTVTNNNQWRHQPFREYDASRNPVDQLKIRYTMNDKFTSIVRTNNVDHHRKRIGLDGVTITPTDKHGICYVYLIVVSATKLVAGYPTSEHSAPNHCIHSELPTAITMN